MLSYPINFVEDDNGTVLATSPDFPELTTHGEDRDDALLHAIDALEEALMKFDDAVREIGTLTDLRRTAGAHVIDHRQLVDEELRDSVIKVRLQYLHEETVRESLDQALLKGPRNDIRVMSYVILVDVLLNQYDFLLPAPQTEESAIAFEQSIINRSNETELLDLACGDNKEHRNRLAQETSPYLLQLAHKPVDWYSWGPEAFQRAKEGTQ